VVLGGVAHSGDLTRRKLPIGEVGSLTGAYGGNGGRGDVRGREGVSWEEGRKRA
jgi:hypothetical protein